MIDLVYQTLMTIINKEQQGYITPTEFNLLANNVQNEIFRNYWEDENRDKNKSNKGNTNKGYSNLAFTERQRITQFSSVVIISKISNIFKLPENLYFIEDDGIISLENMRDPIEKNVVEELPKHLIGFVNRSSSPPTMTYPVYERYSDHIVITPSAITDIKIRYIRKPQPPQWTYFVLPNGHPVFDMSNPSFQDFELHNSEFTNIVLRMLTYCGINLREGEVIQVSEALKNNITKEDETIN